MKRLIFTIAVALLVAGCGTPLFLTANDIANRTQLGMSVAEFKRIAGYKAELDAMTTDYTVYRLKEYAGPEGHEYVASVKLFHFDSRGRLVEVETRDVAPPFPPRRFDFNPLITE